MKTVNTINYVILIYKKRNLIIFAGFWGFGVPEHRLGFRLSMANSCLVLRSALASWIPWQH